MEGRFHSGWFWPALAVAVILVFFLIFRGQQSQPDDKGAIEDYIRMRIAPTMRG